MILSVCPNPSVDTYLYFENFIKGGVNRLIGERHFPGGKGVHVALSVAELGHNSSLLGFWGNNAGRRMLDETEAYGVKCYGPQIVEDNRACYAFRTSDQYNDTEILGMGPVVSDNELNAFYSQFELLVKDAEIVVFSGSWPEGVSDNAYLQMIKVAHKEGKTTIIDTSEKYLKGVVDAGIFGIHLNSYEAEAITGEKSIDRQMAELSGKFQMIALTRGKDGLRFALGKEVIDANVSIEKTHSAVGSGECLTAGIAVGFEKKLSNEDIAKLGVACGAANCLREDLGMFYKKDVDNLFDRVKVLKK